MNFLLQIITLKVSNFIFFIEKSTKKIIKFNKKISKTNLRRTHKNLVKIISVGPLINPFDDNQNRVLISEALQYILQKLTNDMTFSNIITIAKLEKGWLLTGKDLVNTAEVAIDMIVEQKPDAVMPVLEVMWIKYKHLNDIGAPMKDHVWNVLAALKRGIPKDPNIIDTVVPRAYVDVPDLPKKILKKDLPELYDPNIVYDNNTIYYIIGITVVVVAVIAVTYYYYKKKKKENPPGSGAGSEMSFKLTATPKKATSTTSKIVKFSFFIFHLSILYVTLFYVNSFFL